jgi:large subunit ribosomal protein L16
LQSLDWGWVTARQLEAARVAANRASGGQAKVYIRVFPHKPVSGKPAETRMGTGKGDVEYWTACIRPGTVLFEIGGVGEDKAKLAFKRAAHKVPVKVKMIRRLPTT